MNDSKKKPSGKIWKTDWGIYPAQPNIQQTTPWGVLPYMASLGMCRCDAGYGFQAVYSGVRNNNNNNCFFSTAVDR